MAGHRILSVETLHEGWGKLLLLRIELPDRHVLKREVEDHGAAVAVLTILSDGLRCWCASSVRRRFTPPARRMC